MSKRRRSDNTSTSSVSNVSSLNEWDSSLDKIVEHIEGKKTKKKKSKNKNKKTKTSDYTTETEEMANKNTIDQTLEEMNQKLSKMLTKDDKKIFKEIIKDTFLELKEQLLGTIMKRLDVIENDLHEKEVENKNLKEEIKKMKKTINKNDEEFEREINKKNKDLQKTLKDAKTENDKYEERLNELEQYGRRNNMRITNLGYDKPYSTSEETAWQVVNFLNERMDLALSVHEIDIAHRIGRYTQSY